MTLNADGALTFEEAFARLERSVQSLESGGLTLDQALALYEEGTTLAHRCAGLLGQAELKISKLSLLAENGRQDP